MVAITRRFVKRCRAAGPAYNTRGVFGRRLIRLADFIDPENAPRPPSAEPRPDMYSQPIRDVVAEQLARIRQAEGPEKEQFVVALFMFLSLNIDRISANHVQLNAYRSLAHHYGRTGLMAQAITEQFLAATE